MGMMQDFQRAEAARWAEVKAIRSQVKALMGDLARDAAHRRSELNALRSRVRTLRYDVKALMADLTRGDDRRRSEVKALKFQGKALLADLARHDAQRNSEIVGRLSRAATARRAQVWGDGHLLQVEAPPPPGVEAPALRHRLPEAEAVAVTP